MNMGRRIRTAFDDYRRKQYREPKYLILSQKTYRELIMWVSKAMYHRREIVQANKFDGVEIAVIPTSYDKDILEVVS